MAATDPDLAALSAQGRQLLERWLAEFDQSWQEGALEARVRSLPPPGNMLRRPALVEMVKIDLERCWRAGKRVPVEDYLKRYPELGSPDTISVDLIQAEIEARQELGDTAQLVDLAKRFPRRGDELRQLLGQTATKPTASNTPAPPPERLAKKPRPPAKELPGTFGRYQILKKLGQGGMGAVYLALDTQLERKVALKVPHFGPDEGPQALERFRREAKAAATLHHPNLCPVFDVGEQEGIHFLTMAFIEGKSLADVLKDGKGLPPRPVATIVRTLALALQEAHAKGVIHRDLKPSNIMLGPRQEPVIMDFGLARRSGAQDARLTKLGSVMGTPAYMAPEQVKGEVDAMGPGCDIYSLGVILYEMLAGRPPFSGPVMAVLGMVLTQAPEPPSKVRPGLDPALEAICLTAMAKEPAQRYGSMADLAAALAQYLQGVVASTAVTRPSPKLAATEVELVASGQTAPQPFKKQPVPPLIVTMPPTKRKRPAAAPAPSAMRRWLPWVVAGACLLALVAIVLATVVFRVRTRMGVIVLTINEPGAEVYVDDELKVTITSPSDKQPIEIEVPEGKHTMKVVKGGFVTHTQEFTLRPGIRVEFEPVRLAKRPPAKPPETKPPIVEAGGTTKEQDGWVPLFNGTDLTGWYVESGDPQQWAVEDGAIVARSPNLAKRNYLLSNKDYADFTLRLEFMADPKSAAGVVLRGLDGEIIGKMIDHPVIKVADRAQLPQYWAGTTHFVKDDKQFTKPSEDLNLPAGEWHTLVVTVRGDTCTATLAGKKVVDLRLDPGYAGPFVPGLKRSRGKIGFQAHTGSVHYRKVKIKELPPLAVVKEPPAEPGWVPLFNGTDLTGWKEHPQHRWGNWRVVDGLLVGSGKQYNWLFSERGDYTDVHVRVEAQIGPGGNSGVSTRAPFEAKIGVGYEANIGAPGLAHKTGALFFGGRGVPVVPINEDLVPADTWFTLENVTVGNRVIVLVNGKVVVDYTDKDATHRRGHIALQMHDPKTVVRFRKIEVREVKPGDRLPVAAAPEVGDGFMPLFNGKDLTGWQGDERYWSVDGGAIVGVGPPGQGRSYLSTTKSFQDFILRARCKPTSGDSSIMFRGKPNTMFALHVFTGNFMSSGKSAFGNLMDETPVERGVPLLKLTNWDDPQRQAQMAAIKKDNDWNDIVITAIGKHVRCEINNHVVFDGRHPEGPTAGVISLKVLFNTRVAFKDLQIKELKQDAGAGDVFQPLFNGRDLTGWAGITPHWRVEGGAIVGEVPAEGLPKNLFLSPNLPGPLKDFELRLEVKMIKGNSGIQVRSRRVEDHPFTTMLGPQVEIAHNPRYTWSSLVTEPAGEPTLLAPLEKVNRLLKPADFNEMHIRCVGKHITITLNGTVTVDADFPTMPATGLIGLQIHKGFRGMRVEFRNIRFKELVPGAAAADPGRRDPALAKGAAWMRDHHQMTLRAHGGGCLGWLNSTLMVCHLREVACVSAAHYNRLCGWASGTYLRNV
jgi:hypothetical protein